MKLLEDIKVLREEVADPKISPKVAAQREARLVAMVQDEFLPLV